MIPYTHWAYFPDEAGAQRCSEDLKDYVIRIQKAFEGPEWLLLAGRDVAIDDLIERHDQVRAIVERHGGLYDFGESTHDASTGEAVADPMLTGEWDAG
jgi:hypothetical protein